MKFVRQYIDDFSALFRGHPEVYGVHVPEPHAKEGEKAQGKSFTKTEKVIEDLYLKHLHGEQSLGIAPLTPDGNVYFVAIDVDVYPLNPLKYLKVIEKAAFPLVAFRSKSGGLHLYMFFSEPVPVTKVMPLINIIRHLLALPSDTEVFPKQLRLTGGSSGNWINIPFFNFSETKRYAYNQKGQQLELEDALKLAMSSRVTLNQLKELIKALPLSLAPPCLQTIFLSGGADAGERNIFLFNCAVYSKDRFGEDFGENLHALNKKLDSPLDYTELDTSIVSSHNKKDYTYQCKNSILTSYCDKDICRTREHGIDSTGISNLTYEDLVQINTSSPQYIWTVNGSKMNFFSESELINQTKFRELCLRQLHKIPKRMTDVEWAKILNRALENVIVKVPDIADDMSFDSLWVMKVGEFLSRQQAVRPAQLNDGLIYFQASQGRLHFKSDRLLAFLVNSNMFKECSPAQHRKLLKSLGAKQSRMNVGNGVVIRTWYVDIIKLQTEGKLLDVPVNRVDGTGGEQIEPLQFSGEDKF